MNAAALLLMVASQAVGIAMVGQSLCNGNSSTPQINTVQDGSSSMLTGNAFDSVSGGMLAVTSAWPRTALVEATHESPRWGVAAGYRASTGNSVTVLSNCVGNSAYAAMASGTTPFDRLRWLIESHGAHGGTVVAAIAVHGEADHVASTTRATYAANLATWQTDIQTKVRLSTGTGASASVPLVIKQLSAWTSYGQATSTIPLAQYDAMKNGGGAVVIGTADYAAFPYLGADGRHHTNVGGCAMGYKLGLVAGALASNPSWRPLYPTSAVRTGAKIVLTFNVPTGPLELDTTLVSDPGDYGFTYTDDSSPPAISAVELCSGSVDPLCVNSNQVLITLASTPTGANKKIRYAYSATAGNFGGPTTGPRGNLRDSDATSVTCNGTTVPLYNWAVHFEETLS